MSTSQDRPAPSEGEKTAQNSARVVEKALDVLTCLADAERELGVTEIGRKVGLRKSTVHRLLSTLQRRGFVSSNPDTRRYQLGYGVLKLSNALLRQTEIRTLALPYLCRLRDATGETASLTVRQGDQRLHLEQIESLHELKFSLDVGKLLPLVVGASGKSLVAELPEDELDALITATGLPALTPWSITDPAVLKQDLAGVRARGFAVSVSERYPDVISVAAPVRNHRGVVAALNVTGPASRLTLERALGFGPLLAVEARKLSTELGGSPDPAPRRERSSR